MVRILVVRLGAMGDIIHALPAVVSLKQGHPDSRITWIVERRWAPLLEDNPFIDSVVLLDRATTVGLIRSSRILRTEEYDLAVDFQGLLKSALTGLASRTERIFGFHESQVREKLSALFYSKRILSSAAHVVDRNLDLAAAAGGRRDQPQFPLPAGLPEGALPEGDYVLASPLAGWGSKQWPLEFYGSLAERLRQAGIPLVLNGPPGASFPQSGCAIPHFSGIPWLIYATRRATAVVGVDSGPLHLAAALGIKGVAIFGPTDPARNGPYGGSLHVLRTSGAATTYKRGAAIDESMRQISPDDVFEALRPALTERRDRAGCLV